MIANEFRLIGTVVSDFEEAGTMAFPKKKFQIEVEKKSRGKVNTYPITVYEQNKEVDTSKSLRGSVVIVGGYVDIYKDFISLIAQDVVVVGVGKPRVKKADIKPEAPAPSVTPEEVMEDVPPDDDLPF